VDLFYTPDPHRSANQVNETRLKNTEVPVLSICLLKKLTTVSEPGDASRYKHDTSSS